MTTASDEYWLAYLREDAAEHTKETLQRQTMKDTAETVLKLTEREREDLRRALLSCNAETRAWLSPFIDIPGTHQLLCSVLTEERSKAGHDESKALEEFRRRLENDTALRETLNEGLDAVEAAAQTIQATFDAACCSASQVSMSSDTIRHAVAQRKSRTWRDIPEAELAERLAKGEIIPRDDWIPGVSKGGRKLTPAEYHAHMAFATKLKTEGNEAYAQKDFALASTRYSQGVNLLNWVEGSDAVATQEIQDTLLTFLKNQAAAALQLQEYRTAQVAATRALELDAHDSKSRYRRAQASIALGELTDAKADFLAMLRSPYTPTEGHIAARNGLQQLRQIVTRWKSTTKEIIDTATDHAMFSIDRESERQQHPSQPPALPEPRHTSTPLTEIPRHSVPRLWREPQLSEEQTTAILTEILDLYTSDRVQDVLNVLRRDADFEEHRVLLRAKKLLPTLLGPLLEEHNIPGCNFVERKRVRRRPPKEDSG